MSAPHPAFLSVSTHDSTATMSALVLALIASQSSSAQERPTFSSESELVVLHVAVKDRKGGYVGGLGQEAFRVSENKQPQAIRFFTKIWMRPRRSAC